MTQSLDYGQLQDAAKRILARDAIRLNNTNYSAYPGKTVSPMSSLTQKAQELEEPAVNEDFMETFKKNSINVPRSINFEIFHALSL